MAESQDTGQERNLAPTAKRLADARREGQIARSRDLAHLIVVGGGAAALVVLSAPLFGAGLRLINGGLRFDARSALEPAQMGARLGEFAAAGLLALAPFFGLMLLAAVLAPLTVGGWLFSPRAFTLKFSRMNPLSGFKRMLSLRAVVELGKVITIALLLGVVGAFYILHNIDTFAGLATEDLTAAIPHLGWMIALALGVLAAMLAVTAMIDVPFQLFQHHKQLKMTLEEVRRENKETEGDPHIKSRIRQRAREIARARMMAAVPTADVVVTNPTHFAVAIKYLDGHHRAPVVVAKGADTVAERIRELARANGVPRLEAPPLARALYSHVDIGDEIPAALYTAVAQVLAYVFQLRAFGSGRAARPQEPRDIEIPEGLDPGVPAAGGPANV